MPRSERITVAIATLNRPDGLARCLDALLAGQMLPAEVIVVDQSAGDAALRVVEKRRTDAVPLVYIHQSRRGLSASRNAALSAAHYPIFAMTDDDCVPGPGWVAAVEQVFTAGDAPAAATGKILPLGPDAPGLYAVSLRERSDAVVFTGKTPPWHAGSGGNFAVRRERLEQIGQYDERLGAGSPGKASEDLDLTHRLLRSCAAIRYEPNMTVYHERQSLTRRLASRWGYGYGVGAFCGKWLRLRDIYALHVLRIWLSWRLMALAGAIWHRQWRLAYEYWLALTGTACGLCYGLRLRGEY